MTPLWLAAIRAGLAAAVLLCVMLATRSLRIPKRGDVPVVCSIALLHMTAFGTLMAIGLQFVPAAGSANADLHKLDPSLLSLVKGTKVMDDLRIIDLYEAAIGQGVPLSERKGNWVQKFWDDSDALLYATAQFSRYQEVEKFVTEHFTDIAAVAKRVKPGEPS